MIFPDADLTAEARVICLHARIPKHWVHVAVRLQLLLAFNRVNDLKRTLRLLKVALGARIKLSGVVYIHYKNCSL